MSKINRTAVLLVAATWLAAAAGGCMKSQPLAGDRMDQLYHEAPSAWVQAEPTTLTVEGKTLPGRVTLVREQSLRRSIVNLSNLRDRLFQTDGDLQLLISDEVAESVASIVREMADRTERWGQEAEKYPSDSGRQGWANDTASILALLYVLDRGDAAADPRQVAGPRRPNTAVIAPVVRSMITCMMKRMEIETHGRQRLLGTPSERRLPVEFILQGAFRLAELRMPAEAPDEVLRVFEEGPPTVVGVENELRGLLLELRKEAEEDRRPPANRRLKLSLKAVPPALDNMARLLEQWNKFYLLSMELGTIGGRQAVSLVLDVQPGRSVRIDAVHSLAPVVTMEGRVRINLTSSESDAGDQTRVQIINERGGRIAVRFESWIYGLASLFAFPIEDWGLQEMAITKTRTQRHRKDVKVELLLRARDYSEGDDPRRLMRIHTVRRLTVTTKKEKVSRIVRHDTRFEFFRPERMWYYDRMSRQVLPDP